MSENSNDNSLSDKFDNRPLQANENVKWYKLGGRTKEAVLTSIDKNSKHEIPEDSELEELASILGHNFPVRRIEKYYGDCACFPKIYSSSGPNDDNLYMMCPIGISAHKNQSYFIPEDSTEMPKEEIQKTIDDSLPIISKEPISFPLDRSIYPEPNL